MPLPKGQKDYRKNPFNVHGLPKNSLISAGTACHMEATWDKALGMAIAEATKNGAAKTAKALKKLLSWQQRNS